MSYARICLNAQFDTFKILANTQNIWGLKLLWQKVMPGDPSSEEEQENKPKNTIKMFLLRMPVVQHSPSFLSSEGLCNSQRLHQEYNQAEFFGTDKETGMNLVREFVVGERPYKKGAHEQYKICGYSSRDRRQHN